MAETKKVRWGIVGTGRISREFAHDFKFVDNAELVAVGSRSKESAEKFANDFGISTSKAYASYEELYNDQSIEAIYVGTPHNFHFQNTWDAIAAGKHVVCEKPITVNPEELEKLMAFAKQEKKFLMEAMWTYFHPTTLKAQQWVAEGRIGELVQIKADLGKFVPFDANGRMYNPELAGGALLDMGIYPLAVAWLFIQKEPKEIHVVSHKASTGVDDDVNILFDYGEQVANLATSFRGRLSNTLLVIGTEGTIKMPKYWKGKSCSLYSGNNLVDTYTDSTESIGLNHELKAASQSILDGKLESEVMPLSHSYQLQKFMADIMAKF